VVEQLFTVFPIWHKRGVLRKQNSGSNCRIAATANHAPYGFSGESTVSKQFPQKLHFPN
jgi:hypothetical protein